MIGAATEAMPRVPSSTFCAQPRSATRGQSGQRHPLGHDRVGSELNRLPVPQSAAQYIPVERGEQDLSGAGRVGRHPEADTGDIAEGLRALQQAVAQRRGVRWVGVVRVAAASRNALLTSLVLLHVEMRSLCGAQTDQF